MTVNRPRGVSVKMRMRKHEWDEMFFLNNFGRRPPGVPRTPKAAKKGKSKWTTAPGGHPPIFAYTKSEARALLKDAIGGAIPKGTKLLRIAGA